MNPQDFLDAALGQTSQIVDDPETTRRLDRLSASIHALLDDGDDLEPPADLASRTCSVVAERRRKRPAKEYGPAVLPFRWTDLAVAAGIFFAGILTLLPAIQRSRARFQVVSCANNLRDMGVSLNHYAASHGHYPSVQPPYPAGSSLALLHEAGDLPEVSHASCPAGGDCPIHRTLKTYVRPGDVQSRDPERVRSDVEGGYASNPGYYLIGDGLVPARAPDSATPLMADPPDHDGGGVVHEGNSPNHGGGGQNVLFSGGHVGWLHNRWRSHDDTDIYLNSHKRAAPGTHPTDAVLLPSVFSIARP